MRFLVGERPWWLIWAIVLVASLGLRLWVLQLVGTTQLGGDTLNNLRMAENILSGRGLVLDDPFNVPNMRATYPPLYPILLAGVGPVVPLSTMVITLLNTGFDFACAGLIVLVGRQLGLARAGQLAAMAYMLWPTHIGLAPVARKEALLAMLVVALLCLLVALARPCRRVASIDPARTRLSAGPVRRRDAALVRRPSRMVDRDAGGSGLRNPRHDSVVDSQLAVIPSLRSDDRRQRLQPLDRGNADRDRHLDPATHAFQDGRRIRHVRRNGGRGASDHRRRPTPLYRALPGEIRPGDGQRCSRRRPGPLGRSARQCDARLGLGRQAVRPISRPCG